MLLAIDPLQERVHRELMRLYMVVEQPLAALKQFETCSQVLRIELNTEPDIKTVKLAEEITQHVSLTSTQNASQKITSPHLTEASEEISPQFLPLIGREEERSVLLDHASRMFNREGGLVMVEVEAGLPTDTLEALAIAPDGGVWFGTQNKSIVRFGL
jgi:hypothetical protein